MASFLLLPRAKIDQLVAHVDGFISENHQVRVRKLTYPVEGPGANLTDHAIREPYVVTLDGWTSDLMIPASAFSRDRNARAQAAWDAILRLADEREILTVVTLLRTYRRMLITNVNAPVDETSGRALQFQITVEEILTADEIDRQALSNPLPGSPVEDLVGETDRGKIPSVAILDATADANDAQVGG